MTVTSRCLKTGLIAKRCSWTPLICWACWACACSGRAGVACWVIVLGLGIPGKTYVVCMPALCVGAFSLYFSAKPIPSRVDSSLSTLTSICTSTNADALPLPRMGSSTSCWIFSSDSDLMRFCSCNSAKSGATRAARAKRAPPAVKINANNARTLIPLSVDSPCYGINA